MYIERERESERGGESERTKIRAKHMTCEGCRSASKGMMRDRQTDRDERERERERERENREREERERERQRERENQDQGKTHDLRRMQERLKR